MYEETGNISVWKYCYSSIYIRELVLLTKLYLILGDEAEYLGLPYAPPAVSTDQKSVPLTGLNYASGICGILPETGNIFVSNYIHLIYVHHYQLLFALPAA